MNPSRQDRPTLRVYDGTTYEMMSKLLGYEPLILFVEEIVDYSMRQNNISNWIPPMNLEYLRLQHCGKRYFDDNIGKVIGHLCIEKEALKSALKRGFDENLWLTLSPEEARERLIGHLGFMLINAEVPQNLAAFQMFSFGCYVGRAAMKRRKNRLANEVVQALVRTCCIHFPYEKQYAEYLSVAIRYNSEHRCT